MRFGSTLYQFCDFKQITYTDWTSVFVFLHKRHKNIRIYTAQDLWKFKFDQSQNRTLKSQHRVTTIVISIIINIIEVLNSSVFNHLNVSYDWYRKIKLGNIFIFCPWEIYVKALLPCGSWDGYTCIYPHAHKLHATFSILCSEPYDYL